MLEGVGEDEFPMFISIYFADFGVFGFSCILVPYRCVCVCVCVCVFRHARSQDASKAINEDGLD
jgi:hypothetical protein